MLRRAFWIGTLLIFALAQAGLAAELPVTRYLVDGRVHVSLIYRSDHSGGELAWCDTVTGRTGETRFEVHGGSLWFAGAHGVSARARVLPRLALLFESTPWRHPGDGVALGLSVD